MARGVSILASHAPGAGLAAAALWPAAGHPAWPARFRGRPASTVATSLAVAWAVFRLVRRDGAQASD
jgi:hypothetical protein